LPKTEFGDWLEISLARWSMTWLRIKSIALLRIDGLLVLEPSILHRKAT
jgi:hypothetical protein